MLDQMKEERRKAKDFIGLNKKNQVLTAGERYLQSSQMGSARQFTERVEQAKQRRKLADSEMYKIRLCQLIKWDVLKQKRITKEQECDRILEKERKLRALVRVMKHFKVIQRF